MKERMITRTIESYNVKCLYANIKAMTMGECYMNIPGSTPESKMEKAARNAFKESPVYGTGDCTFVSIVDFYKVSELYGMPESEFMANAKLLPPR